MKCTSFLTLFVVGTLRGAVHSAPTPEITVQDEHFAKKYLTSFFHIPEEPGPVALTQKLSEMQRFYGLHITGTLDKDTVALMKMPRCGVPDEIPQYKIFGKKNKWSKKYLTYRIEKYTSDKSKRQVDSDVRKAFKVWSDVTPLRFIQYRRRKADFVLSFGKYSHGDKYDFDGKGKVLAHAFPPGMGKLQGQIHFDDSEKFSCGRTGKNLFIVAVHEIGHILGLSHSSDRKAVMYPTYKYHHPATFRLSKDDVKGIQSLYGFKNECVRAASRLKESSKRGSGFFGPFIAC